MIAVLFVAAVLICLIVAWSCARDAYYADYDHPYGSCTDKRDEQ